MESDGQASDENSQLRAEDVALIEQALECAHPPRPCPQAPAAARRMGGGARRRRTDRGTWHRRPDSGRPSGSGAWPGGGPWPIVPPSRRRPARTGPRGAAAPPTSTDGRHDRSLGRAARFRMLDALEAAERDGRALTISMIGEAIGVDQPRASRLVQEASDAGLVRRTADPADARRSIIELTAAGRKPDRRGAFGASLRGRGCPGRASPRTKRHTLRPAVQPFRRSVAARVGATAGAGVP